MKFIKEHTLLIILSVITLLMAILAGCLIGFVFKQQDLIYEKDSIIIEDKIYIATLSTEKVVLQQEIEDLKETYSSLNIDFEKLDEFQKSQMESIEELKNLLP